MSLEHKARVQSQFGGSAQAYVASPGHAGGEDLERLIEWARKLAPARALDIATGGGHTALALARVMRRVVAAELTGAMLAAARQFIRPTTSPMCRWRSVRWRGCSSREAPSSSRTSWATMTPSSRRA